jgi:hypothetical protein
MPTDPLNYDYLGYAVAVPGDASGDGADLGLFSACLNAFENPPACST